MKGLELSGQKPGRDSQAFAEVVEALGDFHRTLVAPRLFGRVNSTIVLARVNRTLSRIGAAQITPGRLDDYAMVLPRQQYLHLFREAVRIAPTAQRDRPLRVLEPSGGRIKSPSDEPSISQPSTTQINGSRAAATRRRARHPIRERRSACER